MSDPSQKNQFQTNPSAQEVSPSTDAQLVEALAGLNAQADQAVVHRTRRAVMEAAHRMGAAELRHRRQFGTVLLALVALVVLLTPAIWSVADDLFNGEHFQDMPAMTMSLIVTLFSTIFAALILHWRSRQTHNGEKF